MNNGDMDQTMAITVMVTSQGLGVGPRQGLSWGGGANALCLLLLTTHHRTSWFMVERRHT